MDRFGGLAGDGVWSLIQRRTVGWSDQGFHVASVVV
jgi:hypothetical protein